jgi:cytochrome c peroxidase
MSERRRFLAVAAVGLGLAGLAVLATGQSADPPAPPSLKTVAVPEPPNLGEFVRDRTAAIQLGKALFWDMQVGSDGRTACASCHFAAGPTAARSTS